MSVKPGVVALVPITPMDYDDFFVEYLKYSDELEPHKVRNNRKEIVMYRDAVVAELGDGLGREMFWVVEGKLRVGFVMIRCFPDWPDESILIGSISEFYIFESARRRGIGTKAVSIAMKKLRSYGAMVAEADILYSNESALVFWKSLGFDIEFYGTSRRL
jgi:ribosomal protein S18 acetylase RimI-like enzyme